MQILNKRKSLRLVKSTNNLEDSKMTGFTKTMAASDKYYKQVEYYAQQILRASDVAEIINILDVILSETRGLQLTGEVSAAQEQVKHAEQKIELLESELEQLRKLVHTDK